MSTKYCPLVACTGIVWVGQDHYRTVWVASVIIRAQWTSGGDQGHGGEWGNREGAAGGDCRGKKGVERAAGAGGGGVGLDAMDIVDPEDGEEEGRVVEA